MKTPLQVNMTQFDGAPATLLCMYDSETSVLAVSMVSEFKTERVKDALMIGMDSRYELDFAFKNDYFRDSVSAYYELKNGLSNDATSSRLAFSVKASSADPSVAIQSDGYDDRGAKYRFDRLTNAHACTLAVCFWVVKTKGVETALSAQDSIIDELIAGGLVSVGYRRDDPFLEVSIVHGFRADSFQIRQSQAKAIGRIYGSDT